MNYTEETQRLLSEEACEEIWQKVRGFASKEGRTAVQVFSHWNAEVRWSRNSIHSVVERRDVSIRIRRFFGNNLGYMATNQIDDDSLRNAVQECEARAALSKTLPLDMPTSPAVLDVPEVSIWSDSTFSVPTALRGEVAQLVSSAAHKSGVMASGFIEFRGASVAKFGGGVSKDGNQGWWVEEYYNPQYHDEMFYTRMTQAQCSMTVRHPEGIGSGWAGLSSYDWSQIDKSNLVETALDKCMRSIDPYRIEPGRYTVILEPQAVSTFADILIGPLRRGDKDSESHPFALGVDDALNILRYKLGLKIIDERITISHDPSDSEQGVIPEPGLKPITWIENGVLKSLSYDRDYSRTQILEEGGEYSRSGYKIAAGTTSMEDMIASTQRGLVVTRFSNVTKLSPSTLLSMGLTRDGLWLVENGKIVRAVRNMRFTESPLFVFNQVEQIGPAVPVFHPERDWMRLNILPAIVPPMKIKDFSFTMTADGV